jgi:hypothetical protein
MIVQTARKLACDPRALYRWKEQATQLESFDHRRRLDRLQVAIAVLSASRAKRHGPTGEQRVILLSVGHIAALLDQPRRLVERAIELLEGRLVRSWQPPTGTVPGYMVGASGWAFAIRAWSAPFLRVVRGLAGIGPDGRYVAKSRSKRSTKAPKSHRPPPAPSMPPPPPLGDDTSAARFLAMVSPELLERAPPT